MCIILFIPEYSPRVPLCSALFVAACNILPYLWILLSLCFWLPAVFFFLSIVPDSLRPGHDIPYVCQDNGNGTNVLSVVSLCLRFFVSLTQFLLFLVILLLFTVSSMFLSPLFISMFLSFVYHLFLCFCISFFCLSFVFMFLCFFLLSISTGIRHK